MGHRKNLITLYQMADCTINKQVFFLKEKPELFFVCFCDKNKLNAGEKRGKWRSSFQIAFKIAWLDRMFTVYDGPIVIHFKYGCWNVRFGPFFWLLWGLQDVRIQSHGNEKSYYVPEHFRCMTFGSSPKKNPTNITSSNWVFKKKQNKFKNSQSN